MAFSRPDFILASWWGRYSRSVPSGTTQKTKAVTEMLQVKEKYILYNHFMSYLPWVFYGAFDFCWSLAAVSLAPHLYRPELCVKDVKWWWWRLFKQLFITIIIKFARPIRLDKTQSFSMASANIYRQYVHYDWKVWDQQDLCFSKKRLMFTKASFTWSKIQSNTEILLKLKIIDFLIYLCFMIMESMILSLMNKKKKTCNFCWNRNIL